MLDLKHQYNNCTITPHVRGCCAVVVLVLYKNQIPINKHENEQILFDYK
jgi:hypothetical protein